MAHLSHSIAQADTCHKFLTPDADADSWFSFCFSDRRPRCVRTHIRLHTARRVFLTIVGLHVIRRVDAADGTPQQILAVSEVPGRLRITVMRC
jgi:hypothetical protein